MRVWMVQCALLCAAAAAALSQTAPCRPAAECANPQLEAVLSRMDQSAASFKTAEARFVWDQYQRVVSETDTQKGTIYFRRAGKEVRMAADISDPASEKKYVLYNDGKVRVYQPRIDQVNEYKPGANRAEVESFLVLGFGGGGHSLERTFQVRYAGSEQVQGARTDKLELVPKSQKGRSIFDRILLWIDSRGVSVQQQFFESSGDYRLARYSNIKLNEKLPDDVFKLKTTSKTKVVSATG